jgi:hypothetical protein
MKKILTDNLEYTKVAWQMHDMVSAQIKLILDQYKDIALADKVTIIRDATEDTLLKIR